MQLNTPTYLTIFRMITIPFFVITFYLPFSWAPICCTLIFVAASVTDWFDGFLARRWKQTTKFGAFLDPVADKIMVVMALILVVQRFHSWWMTLPAAIIITREIIILALREWMAEIGKRIRVSVSWIGKIKTMAQILALSALIWRPDEIVSKFGIIILYVAVVFTFWSMLQYIYAARHDLFMQYKN